MIVAVLTIVAVLVWPVMAIRDARRFVRESERNEAREREERARSVVARAERAKAEQERMDAVKRRRQAIADFGGGKRERPD